MRVVPIDNMLQLPHGPWKLLLSGVWSGKEVSYHENPDKTILISIYDKRGDNISGVVLLMTRFFSVEGSASRLSLALDENSVIIEKHTPTFKGSYLAVSTNPVYIKYSPRDLINKTAELYNTLRDYAKDVRAKAGNYKVKVTDIRYSDLQSIHELFGEPLALPSIMVRKAGPKTMVSSNLGKMHLGKTKDNARCEEAVQSAMLATITGEKEHSRLYIAQVLLEGCILNGVSAVVFDREEKFTKIDSPNPDVTYYSKYDLHVDPIGMPVRRFTPGTDMFIDLTLLDGRLFSEITGISGKTAEIIGGILEQKQVKNLAQLSEKLQAMKREDVRYYAHRGIRVVHLLNDLYPGLFSGQVEPKEIVAPWLKKMGRIALIQLKGLDESLVKGIMYTVLKTLYENYKKELASGDIKVEVLLDMPSVVSGKGSHLDREIDALVKLASEYGIGMCILAQSELDIDKEIFDNATMRIGVINNNEVKIEEHTKRPYKAFIRPSLSAL